jgi:hypothetical protein
MLTATARSPELHGVDRAVVLLGTFLVETGRRRAEARARRLEPRAAAVAARAGRARDTAVRERDARRSTVVERRRDNAAQVNPLGLR